MLKSNGRIPKQRKNYFMTLSELKDLLKYLRVYYDSKWYVFVITQFSLGLRCSECAAINLHDFKDDFKIIDYRQAKTNKIIHNEPIPDPLRFLIKNYIYNNLHRLKDGYLFPNYTGKGNHYTTETIGSFWSKWRRGCAKFYNNSRWLDVYDDFSSGKRRYRISSHSLRRLHRTFLSDKIKDDFVVSKLCHYDDFNSYLRYKNEFELLKDSDKYIMPHLEPLICKITDTSKGQTSLNSF